MVKVKICGLKRLEDIEIVNRYKPDYIGFVFADSKRKVTHELAGKLRQNLDSEIIPVGVFVDADIDEIVGLFNRDIIEIAQLHGNESEDYIINLKQRTNNELKIIKAIEMADDINLLQYDSSHADYLLMDSGKGSGKTFDWRLIRKDLKKEFFLAGGLDSTNIAQAVYRMRLITVGFSHGLIKCPPDT